MRLVYIKNDNYSSSIPIILLIFRQTNQRVVMSTTRGKRRLRAIVDEVRAIKGKVGQTVEVFGKASSPFFIAVARKYSNVQVSKL